MSASENKEIVRRYWEGRFNEKDYDAVDKFVKPGPDLANLRAWVVDYHAAFDDVRMTLDYIIAEDDLVAVHFTCESTHIGEWYGFAPTGSRITTHGMALCWLAEGMIVKDDVAYSDGYEVLATRAKAA